MYLLQKCTWGDFDIQQIEVVAVSMSKDILEIEAAKLNENRKESDWVYGEWTHEFKVSPKRVKVL